MSRRQSNYVRVDPSNPQSAGQCDLCGFWFALRDLTPQTQWAGTHIFQFNSLRCWKCLDVPNEQLRTIILPPDPPPMQNSRVPNFAFEQQTIRITQAGTLIPNANPPWNAGPQRLRVVQGTNVARIIQLNTSG
jgi:hypothetical protein